jgi:sugar lactone lactonase YvrE
LFAGAIAIAGAADGTGGAARFDGPTGLAVSPQGYGLWVSDTNNQTIRSIDFMFSSVGTHAGTVGRTGCEDYSDVRLASPLGLAFDQTGTLFVADRDNNTIREIKIPTPLTVRTFAGAAVVSGSADGIGSAARFYSPDGVALDGAGNLYVADGANQTIRQVVIATGQVTTLAGAPGQQGSADGTGSAARFAGPIDIVADGAGNLFVPDNPNFTIRQIVIATGAVTTLAGSPGQSGTADGTGAAARFSFLDGITTDHAGNLYVSDGNSIRKVVISSGQVSTVATIGSTLGGLVYDSGKLYVARSLPSALLEVDVANGAATALSLTGAPLVMPISVTTDGAGNLFVTDGLGATIDQVAISSGFVTTLAGRLYQEGARDGTGGSARFRGPDAIVYDGAGNLYIADFSDESIRTLDVATGAVTTLAGAGFQVGSADGRGAAARFNQPTGLVAAGGNLYIADSANHTIRLAVIATGDVTTLAGTAGQPGSVDDVGPAARFNFPGAIAADDTGSLFVADTANHTIRRVVIETGAVSTFAGAAGQPGSVDAIGTAARFHSPTGISFDGAGNLYVADSANHTIRKIDIATGEVTTRVGDPNRSQLALGPLPAQLNTPQDVVALPDNQLAITDVAEHVVLLVH